MMILVPDASALRRFFMSRSSCSKAFSLRKSECLVMASRLFDVSRDCIRRSDYCEINK